MTGLIIRGETWNRTDLDPAFTGSCRAHRDQLVARSYDHPGLGHRLARLAYRGANRPLLSLAMRLHGALAGGRRR